MRFNDDSFDATARALFKLNPSVRAGFKAPADLVQWMRAFTYRELGDGHLGYAGTYGFYVTTYNHPTGEIGAFATISAHLVDTRELV